MNPVLAFLLFVSVILINLGLFVGLGEVSKGVAWFVGLVTGIVLLIAWRAVTSESAYSKYCEGAILSQQARSLIRQVGSQVKTGAVEPPRGSPDDSPRANPQITRRTILTR